MYYAVAIIFILIIATVIFSVSRALATFKKIIQDDELSSKSDENSES